MLATDERKAWEIERVKAWRTEMLLLLGISHADAITLAFCPDIDWHEAEQLVAKGCPPELVFELLT
jgi:hypothetical protein